MTLIYTADLGEIIVLKIRPEEDFVYFVYNDKLKNVVRIDSLKDTCRFTRWHGIISRRILSSKWRA